MSHRWRNQKQRGEVTCTGMESKSQREAWRPAHSSGWSATGHSFILKSHNLKQKFSTPTKFGRDKNHFINCARRRSLTVDSGTQCPFQPNIRKSLCKQKYITTPECQQLQWQRGVSIRPPISELHDALQFNYLQHFSVYTKEAKLPFLHQEIDGKLRPRSQSEPTKERSQPPKSPLNTKLYPSLNIKIQCNWPSLPLPWSVGTGGWEVESSCWRENGEGIHSLLDLSLRECMDNQV